MIVWLGNALLVLSAIFATAFVVLYAVAAPWWRGQIGRNVMALMFVIAAVLDLSCIRVLVPVTVDVTWFAILRVVVFAFVPVVLGQRLWLLIKVQILRRRDGGAER
jgi:hypothetical protein